MPTSHPNFYPVVLAGGRGTRFWPLSRKRRAKQLLALDGKRTMIQQTVARLLPLAPARKFWVITNRDSYREIVRQMGKLPRNQIIAEPVGRNTAPAIGLAAFILRERAFSFRPRDRRRGPLSGHAEQRNPDRGGTGQHRGAGDQAYAPGNRLRLH
jgi:hypothetical protein